MILVLVVVVKNLKNVVELNLIFYEQKKETLFI
jgi:hypothetical protein